VSHHTFLLYLATWLIVALFPGPAVMLSVAQSAKHGFRPSLAGIAGIQCGNLALFVCVALGLGAILSSATGAFTVLRIAGALYLLYLGVRTMIRSFSRTVNVAPESPISTPGRGLFLQGVLVQLTNPKVLLFVSALVPQFMNPAASSIPQLSALAAGTIAVDLIVLSTYAYVVQRGLRRFQTLRARVWLERVFGATLMFFGVRLLLARR
jgi:homoserine/homoserine lactone efflux protein